jgi:hypothetical protein
MKKYYKCRVCGLEILDSYTWEEIDGELFPSYDICPCCGVEHGLGDETLDDVRFYRNYWVAVKKCKYYDLKDKPENWSIEKQLEQIEEEWY